MSLVIRNLQLTSSLGQSSTLLTHVNLLFNVVTYAAAEKEQVLKEDRGTRSQRGVRGQTGEKSALEEPTVGQTSGRKRRANKHRL